MWYCGYVDWHVANGVVLVPIVGDHNDDRALALLAEEVGGTRPLLELPDRAVLAVGRIMDAVAWFRSRGVL